MFETATVEKIVGIMAMLRSELSPHRRRSRRPFSRSASFIFDSQLQIDVSIRFTFSALHHTGLSGKRKKKSPVALHSALTLCARFARSSTSLELRKRKFMSDRLDYIHPFSDVNAADSADLRDVHRRCALVVTMQLTAIRATRHTRTNVLFSDRSNGSWIIRVEVEQKGFILLLKVALCRGSAVYCTSLKC